MYNPYDDPYASDSSGGKQINIAYKRNNIFKNKKTGSATVNAGGAIIIIIFVVLCLTIFGILSFTTAFADKRLADRTLLSVQQYYEADTAAEQMLAAVYEICYGHDGLNVDAPWLLEQVIEAIEIDGVKILSVSLSEPFTVYANVSYQTQMNDVQALYSEIMIYRKDNGRLDYRILSWNIILTADFDYGNQGLDVFVWQDDDFGDFDFWAD